MKNRLELLRRLWCKLAHEGAMNLTYDTYECPVCHLVHPYDWWNKKRRSDTR